MKKTITFTFITLLSASITAQSLLPIRYGIKIGANIANVVSNANDGAANIANSKSIGVAGGFYMEIPLNDTWYLNTELIYSQKGAEFTYKYMHDYGLNQRDLHVSLHQLKLAYVELSPNISFKGSSKLSLNIGPYASYLITPDYSVISDSGEDDGDLHEVLPSGFYTEEDLDFGINAGISYYLSENFLLDGRVSTGLMSIGNVSKLTYTGTTDNLAKSNIYDLKNNGIIISIAYLF